jgi:hypothetical protein
MPVLREVGNSCIRPSRGLCGNTIAIKTLNYLLEKAIGAMASYRSVPPVGPCKGTPQVRILLEECDGGRYRIKRKGWLVGRQRSRQRAGWPPSARGVFRHSMLERSLQWPHPTGVCAKIANGGKLIQGQRSRTTRWAYAPKKRSRHSVCASRGIVAVIAMRLASRHMPQGPVLPLRLQSRNAKAVQGRQIGVEASGRASPRGDLAVKIPSWTGSTHAAGWREVSKREVFRDTFRWPFLYLYAVLPEWHSV